MASEGAVVLSFHDVLIRQSDFNCLDSPSGWLNDIIISFWFEYLAKDLFEKYSRHLFVLYPEISQVLKSSLDTSEIKFIIESTGINDSLSSLKLILVPVNDMSASSSSVGGSHWSLLAYSPQKKLALHFDSHGSSNFEHAKLIYQRLMSCLSLKPSKLFPGECVQQSNCHDCGIHVCANAQALCQLNLVDEADSDQTVMNIANEECIKSFRRKMIQIVNKLKEK